MLCLDASLVLLTWPALAAALVLNTTCKLDAYDLGKVDRYTANENEHVISQDLAMSSSTGILDSRSLASTPASVYDVTYWELRRVQETVARSETNDTEWQWSVVTELTASSVTSGNCSFPDTTGTGTILDASGYIQSPQMSSYTPSGHPTNMLYRERIRKLL